MVTVEQVKERIASVYPGVVIDISDKGDRIGGVIRWGGFANMPIPERRKDVTDKVRNALGYEASNVGIIIALAPGES